MLEDISPIFSVAEGKILFKPRLKYELILSLHALHDPSHHKQVADWARVTRARLPADLQKDIDDLMGNRYQQQLLGQVEDLKDGDDLEEIMQCLQTRGEAKFSDILQRYWAQSFKADYECQYAAILRADAEQRAQELENLNFEIPEILEKWTGRKFQGDVTLVFYPSFFAAPHSYGQSECGKRVIIYQTQSNFPGFVRGAFHELLHPLLAGWHRSSRRMKSAIKKLGKNKTFERDWGEIGRNDYCYPDTWAEENIVMALSNFLIVKAGLQEATDTSSLYTQLQRDLYAALLNRYSPEKYAIIDEFLLDFFRKILSRKRIFR